jgi:hypothetical protein
LNKVWLLDVLDWLLFNDSWSLNVLWWEGSENLGLLDNLLWLELGHDWLRVLDNYWLGGWWQEFSVFTHICVFSFNCLIAVPPIFFFLSYLSRSNSGNGSSWFTGGDELLLWDNASGGDSGLNNIHSWYLLNLLNFRLGLSLNNISSLLNWAILNQVLRSLATSHQLLLNFKRKLTEL